LKTGQSLFSHICRIESYTSRTALATTDIPRPGLARRDLRPPTAGKPTKRTAGKPAKRKEGKLRVHSFEVILLNWVRKKTEDRGRMTGGIRWKGKMLVIFISHFQAEG